ncbi:sigma-54-dependent Fis family transcriptional regulator [Bacillaceae bacterium SAS-127]|nr:sigma-54-dependent Fis family transcriptional regulator [Bacillaceae bacterium SAS-127]
MEVNKILSPDFITLTPTHTVQDALTLFLQKRQDIACVFEKEKFLGIVTKYSLYRLLLRSSTTDIPIKGAVIQNIISLYDNENLYRAKDILVKHKIANAIVMDKDENIIGVLSRSNIFQALIAETQHLTKQLSSLMDNLQEVILSVDLNLHMTATNKAAIELIGKNRKHCIGAHIETCFPSLVKNINQVVSTGELIDMKNLEINNISFIGSFIPIKAWEQITGVMIVLEAVTKYEKVARELETTKHNGAFSEIISTSSQINVLKKNAEISAKGFSNILITGESGTGKELFANGIHQASEREGNFIKVNCAAIPHELMESEFFGYEEGAFTGSRKGGKPGKFELANKGTLFLDEIGDMPLSLQVKLLRVLQEKEFERVGGTKTIRTDVRILAATNKDLLKMVHEGAFREDLYYRINVIHLRIPPLRERLEDLPLLCDYFINKFKNKTEKNILGVSTGALLKLQTHHWPGNIRELENVLERAFHFCNAGSILPEHIVLDIPTQKRTSQENDKKFTPQDLKHQKHMNDTEKQLIIQALSNANGNRTKAANTLGISRSSLYQKIKKYQIQQLSQFN